MNKPDEKQDSFMPPAVCYRLFVVCISAVLCSHPSLGGRDDLAGTLERGIGTIDAYRVDRFDDEPTADGCDDMVPNDCSLRGAVRTSNGDSLPSSIILPDGVFVLDVAGANEDLAMSGDLDLGADGLILLSVPGSRPIIQQQTSDRILHIPPSGGPLEIRGPLVLLGGVAANASGPEQGGSLHFEGLQSLSLTDVEFKDGAAPDSGGCLHWQSPVNPGALTMTRVSFSGCTSGENGGAFAIEVGASVVELERVVAEGNTAAVRGGAGWIHDGSTLVQINRSSFTNNTAADSSVSTSWGGGLALVNGDFSVSESTIARNSAGYVGGAGSVAGGLLVRNSNVVLSNSTLSENRSVSASALGNDAMVVDASYLGVSSSTLKGHDVVVPESINIFDAGSTLELFSSIVRAQCTGQGTVASGGLNVEHPISNSAVTHCNLVNVSDVLTTSPLLGELAGYGGPTPTHRLLAAAAGTALIVPAADCADTDQRGAERSALFCYAGAYEHGVVSPGPWIFSDGFESGNHLAW